MKIFLDTADVKKIKELAQTGLIDGVTTNPSHLSKEGGDPKKVVFEICSLLPEGEISIEVTESEPKAVYEQAKRIADLANNVFVKVPCHAMYYEIINKLVQDGVRLNVTLVFTLVQGMLMAKLGVAYISPFVGRWDDIDVEGIELLNEMRFMLDEYEFETELLAASLRSVRHVNKAIMAGANAATIPLDVFEKATVHLLTDQGIEKFNKDWQKLDIKQFP